MKSRLDELYEERDRINHEIGRLKRLQHKCNHTFTPLIYDPETVIIDPETKQSKVVERWYRKCVSCSKIEYSYSFEEPKYVPELSYKKL